MAKYCLLSILDLCDYHVIFCALNSEEIAVMKDICLEVLVLYWQSDRLEVHF